jgi:hypothetical protein
MPDIEDFLDLVSIINEQPARYLPLADEINARSSTALSMMK